MLCLHEECGTVVYGNDFAKLNLIHSQNALFRLYFSLFCMHQSSGPELIPVDSTSPARPHPGAACGDHLHRHADLNRLAAQVGQLGGHQRALLQLDQRHGVGGGLIEASRGFINGGVREHFALAAEGKGRLGLAAAVRADIAGREDSWRRSAGILRPPIRSVVVSIANGVLFP